MLDPNVGEWMTEDPIDFDGGDPNLRRFVRNGPTNATDLSGLKADLDYEDIGVTGGVHLDNNGEYSWRILWKVPPGSSGVIIQRVTMTLVVNEKFIDGGPKTYWEAWEVVKGVPKERRRFNANLFDDVFHNDPHPNSRGFHEVFAKAWYFEGMKQLPPGFKLKNKDVPEAGPLFSFGPLSLTGKPPTIDFSKAGNEVIRNVRTEWDCSDGVTRKTFRRFQYSGRGIVDINNDAAKELRLPRPDERTFPKGTIMTLGKE